MGSAIAERGARLAARLGRRLLLAWAHVAVERGLLGPATGGLFNRLLHL
jgi:hypothetical protein